MLYLLLFTAAVGLFCVTGIGAVSSIVYFLLSHPPVLAIVVIAFCLFAPSDDGHTCEQRDKYGRLVPCYPAPGSLPNSERMGRMCRAAERRRALRRLWRDVAYFANLYTRAARPGVAVVCTLLREVYKCLREVCRCLREVVVCLAPIVASAAALVVKAFCVSSTARRVMVGLISICALAYLLASMVAGLLLDERNTPGLGCILGYMAQFAIVAGLFHHPLWQYAKTTGTVSRVIAGIRAEMDEYDASPDGSTRRGKRARTCAQPQVKREERKTSTRSSHSSIPTKYPAQLSRTGGSDSSPSSSLSSIAQSSMSTSRVSRNEKEMASSPATSVSSVESKKHTKPERKSIPAAIPRADGATKKQSSKSKASNQTVQSKRDQVAGVFESARGAMASRIPKPTSKESNAVAAGSNTAPTLASVTKTKGQVEAEMEKFKPKAETGTLAEPTNVETASKANTHIVEVIRQTVARSDQADVPEVKAAVASTPKATPVGMTSSTSPSALPPKATSELESSLSTADLNTCGDASVSPSSVQTPKPTERSIRPSQTGLASPLVLKSLPRAASVQVIRIHAPAPYPQASVSVPATRAARAELKKKKQAAKKAKLARLLMRLAAKPSAAPVYAAKPNEPTAISAAQSESVDVPEMPMIVAPVSSDLETDVRQRSPAASCETTKIVCEVNSGTTSADQSMSPPKASSEEVSTAAQPAIQPAPSPVAPTPQKVATPPNQPVPAPRAPPSIRRKPVDGASFFKSCKPAPRPAPLTSSTKSSGSDAKQARAPPAPAPNTSASMTGPSISHTPVEKELLAACKETFGVKRPSMGTESDLDLALAAAPVAPGACRQLGRVETKKATVKKNVMYTMDAQGKQQVKAGEVKKDEYVYKWNLDLGMPGVRMRAPKELWEGN